MTQLRIRSARQENYADILALENNHYIDNLDAAERENGFLSARMSEEQVDAMANDLGIAVAYEGEDLIGFFCVSRTDHWRTDSIVHRLVDSLKMDFHDGRVADPQNYCIFGPMCLSSAVRGKSILSQLYEHAVANLNGRVAAAAGFISIENPRSLAAMAKLGWYPVGRFRCGQSEYHALIRDLA